MLKVVITIMLILYVVMIGIWCYRFPISYKLTNGSSHDLVVDHDFTDQEREGVKKAFYIRRTLSNVLIFSSILVSVCSYIMLHKKSIKNKKIVKIILYVSAFIAIVLIFVNGIGFVPNPPIR